jgi:formylglycine-generating enzyme required for sulfatase activity
MIRALRRAALEVIRKDPPKKRLADALVDARILVTDSASVDTPTVEVAHEAVFSGWRRLSRWIESHAGELRTCRSLTRAARDWQEAGAPSFKHLPDRATLKQYHRVRPACSLGEDVEMVGRFLDAARRRQAFWGGFLALVLLVVSILGVDIWLRSQRMNRNVLRIWAQAKVGLYDGPVVVEIPGGTFLMGSRESDRDSLEDEFPQHAVSIQPFLMGKYEVTFDEYSAFVLDTSGATIPPDQAWGRDQRPVISVSWEDAKDYAKWLSNVTGKSFRLPTEADWEYASRSGGKEEKWSGTSNEAEWEDYAWYFINSEGQTHPVGKKNPNGLGLHDMSGNVWEWVEYDYHDNYDGAPADGSAWVDKQRGADRVFRGGCWFNDAGFCRAAGRDGGAPDYRSRTVGFRLARSVALGP